MRFVLKQADPRTLAGLYKYGPATIWVSGPSGGTWWATVKFRSQEKDLDARSYEGVMNAAIRWIDEAPELARTKRGDSPARRRDPKRSGFYVQAPLSSHHEDITSQARWALGLGRETRYPQNLETLHATLPSGMKVRLLRKPARSSRGAHRTSDRLQAYCEYCGKWFGTGNIDQHQIVHGVGSERQLQRYEHLKSKGYPASLKRHRESRTSRDASWAVGFPSSRGPGKVRAVGSKAEAVKVAQAYSKAHPDQGYVDVLRNGMTVMDFIHGRGAPGKGRER